MTYRKCHKGAALLISMIVLAILSAWAVSICSISGLNVQLAENQRKANRARACAESGFEAIRYWLSGVSVMGTTEPEEIFTKIGDSLDLAASGIPVNHDSSSIIIPAVTLDSAKEQSFSAVLRPLDAETIQVDITGVYGIISRTIRVNYKLGTRAHTVFDYGVATKGPLSLAGNIELEGINVSVEASVYIETEGSIDYALSITGNSQIAGDVSLTNSSPAADIVDLQGGQASIGGETAPEAYDHVSTGAPPTEFPVPNPDYFKELVYDYLNTPESFDGTTFENIIIPPNTNPSFTAGTTLKGIVFIETPNVVTFTGHAEIIGIIVGDGDLNDDSGTNQINFTGTIDSSAVSELPGEAQFDPLRDQTGTFLMAPGFSVSFGGNFSTLNGAMAANGIEFFGNAGGTINGSVINYSQTPMTLSGDSDLFFNRLEAGQVPAGFEPEIILQYDPTSYSEVVL